MSHFLLGGRQIAALLPTSTETRGWLSFKNIAKVDTTLFCSVADQAWRKHSILNQFWLNEFLSRLRNLYLLLSSLFSCLKNNFLRPWLFKAFLLNDRWQMWKKWNKLRRASSISCVCLQTSPRFVREWGCGDSPWGLSPRAPRPAHTKDTGKAWGEGPHPFVSVPGMSRTLTKEETQWSRWWKWTDAEEKTRHVGKESKWRLRLEIRQFRCQTLFVLPHQQMYVLVFLSKDIRTCSEDPFQAIRSPGRWSPCLSWRAWIRGGGWRMGLWRKVRRRITSVYQHLNGAQQTDAVLARQQDGLLHHPVTDRATQLLFHALHVGLERRRFGAFSFSFKGLNQWVNQDFAALPPLLTWNSVWIMEESESRRDCSRS